ncbi:polymorphic toxin-type HINT domain-containing protein, partial [Amycolatopsis taiwanensis]|uniref:polymorphic toxin-type HINT domain-containing protein n=1 Tax=Amycolatopsis taiwanensis TaxID=342230 RepID=UPI0025570226
NYPAAGQPQPHAIQTLDTTGPAGSTQAGYTYDPAGRTLTQGTADAGLTFTYDAEGRLATATDASGKVSSYTYDADGNLLFTTDPTGTTLTLGDLELFRAAGGSSTVGTRFYTFNNQVVAEQNFSTGLSWMLADNQNTTYATLKADNLDVAQRWQDPYGVPRGPAPTNWPDKHGYVGGYQNTTGLTHLGARDYDPTTGRFTTVDPILDTTNPQQMNGYAYAGNSPITFNDATGLLVSIDGYPAPISTVGVTDPAELARANKYNNAVNNNRKRGEERRNKASHSSSSDVQLTGTMHPPSRAPAPPTVASPPSAVPTGPDDPRLDAHGEISCGTEIAIFCGVYYIFFESFVECGKHPGLNADCGEAALSLAPGVGKAAGWVVKGLRVGKDARAAGKAATALEDVAKGCRNSFTGDTPVLMADGSTKPIDQVKVGDKILNAQPDNDKTETHTVTAIHITDTDHDFVDLTITTPDGPKTIITTAHHPFWDATTHTWTDATNLTPGDLLNTLGNQHATIESLNRYTTTTRTYNLTIDQIHTYYVLAGPTPVLVHNTKPCVPGVGDVPTRVANSNMPHAAERAVERLDEYKDIASARRDLQSLGKSIQRDGFPEGTIPDTNPGRVLVPFGKDGYAVYQIKANGAAILKTVLNRR